MARQLIDQMNRDGTTKLLPHSPPSRFDDDQLVERECQARSALAWDEYISERLSSGDETNELSFDALERSGAKTLGYVTRDACPGIGDDIEHISGKLRSLHHPDGRSS